ncbi:MAG: AAA family ATPase [Colwellia sp.]
MKPRYLSIQAFGPFAAKEDIDFNKLGSHPLFLINGPTGAGKSSILDAICFALYGQTTGSERSASQMRCDHGDGNLITKVTLEFTIANRRYKIMRIPTQERIKKHGEGTTLQQAEATLWELNSAGEETLLVPKKVSEADKEIKELLGLSVEQFRQVMVLPQGKFRELLLADSKDREKIFSQLFQTSIYKKIEEKLKVEASQIKKEVEQHKHQVLGIIKGAGLEKEEDLDDELKDISPKRLLAQDKKITEEKRLRDKEKALEVANTVAKQFSTLLSKKQLLKEQKQFAAEMNVEEHKLKLSLKANKIKHVFDNKNNVAAKCSLLQKQYSVCVDSLNELNLHLNKSLIAFEKADKAYTEVDKLKERISQLTQFNELLKSLEQAKKALLLAENNQQHGQQLLHKAQVDIEQDKLTLKGYEKDTTKLLNVIEQLADNKSILEQTSLQLGKRSQLEELYKENRSLVSQNGRLRDVVEQKKESFSDIQRQVKQVEFDWHGSQASLLATALSKDNPCPVCGSLNHPNPASSLDGEKLISKEDVDVVRELERKSKLDLDKSNLEYDISLDKISVNKKQSELLATELGQIAKEPIEQLTNKKNNLKIKVEELVLTKEKLAKSIEQAEKLKNDLAEKLVTEQKFNEAAQKDNETVISQKATLAQINSQVPMPYREEGVLDSEFNQITKQVSLLTNALESARSNLSKVKSDLDKADSNKDALETQLESENQALSLAEKAWFTALSESQFTNEAMFEASRLDENTQSEIEQKLARYKLGVENLIAVVAQLELDLSDQSQPNLIELEQSLLEQHDLYEQVEKSWRALDDRANQLIIVQSILTKVHKKNESLERKYNTIGTLYEVSNGLTGNKISLQRFVLSVLLDDVLVQASVRLSIMSKGRYQLVRKSDKAKGNKASGLELEVDDAYTGKIRSVATLSGGESFLAALSLALGVSDVVQSYSGGIKLETLFIDEGFGSLDPDALELAIRALIDLQSTGRMIGIISHVSELKEQMALRIDVKRGKVGSEISIRQ